MKKASIISPPPKTAGIYGTSGKVIDYLEGQGLMPYFEMGDRYGPTYLRMVDLLYRIEEQADKQRTEFRKALDEMSEGTIGSPWLDVDATVAAYSNAAGLPLPCTIELADTRHRAVTALMFMPPTAEAVGDE